MLDIRVKNSDEEMIEPQEMLNWHKYPHGTVFQQYMKKEPQKNFYITCGSFEKRLVNIWFNDEDEEYNLSTSDHQELSEYYDFVKFKKVDAEIIMEILIK